jgi:peptidoglycan/LPS O-acetylase OafA/YrhL
MSGRLRALDGLRGLLALYILAGHTAPFLRLPASADWASSLLSHGRGAVELFFILSGMVILRSLDSGFSRMSAGRFLLARAGRLLPVYAVALAVAVAALSCGDPFRVLPWLADSRAALDIAEAAWPQPWLAHLAAHVTLTQGLLPPAVLPDVEFTILGPAWSLSTEWQFYLVVAAILAVRGPPRPGSADWRAFAAATLAVGAMGLLMGPLPVPWQPGRAFLPHEAWYFALGIASHGLLVSGQKSAARWWVLSLAACVFCPWQQNPWTASVVPLLWTACLICEASEIRSLFHPLARVLGATLLQWLGRVSFPLYLIHIPVQRLLLLAIAPVAGAHATLFSLLWGPVAILAPLIVAYALHRWVEAPCWQWSRRRAQSPRAGRQPIPARQGFPLARRGKHAHQPIDGG